MWKKLEDRFGFLERTGDEIIKIVSNVLENRNLEVLILEVDVTIVGELETFCYDWMHVQRNERTTQTLILAHHNLAFVLVVVAHVHSIIVVPHVVAVGKPQDWTLISDAQVKKGN